MGKNNSFAECYFFAEIDKFVSLTQLDPDRFGPVEGDEANRFRITSKFNISQNIKAYAVTDGHLFFAPHGDDPKKINIILRPVKPINVGVKIKYFVYRGILKEDIFEEYGGGDDNLKLILNDPTTNLPFVNRLWSEFAEYNDLDEDSSEPAVFSATELGYKASDPADKAIIKEFFKNQEDGAFNLPRVKMGDHIGFFGVPPNSNLPNSNTLGFEVVVDFGDYEQETSEAGFELGFSYAQAKECVLNVASNNEDVYTVGNMPFGIGPKVFKENIYHFIDPASFYGGCISWHDAKPASKILTDKWFTQYINWFEYQDQAYDYVISKFASRNNVYLYLLEKRGRSYNFYAESPDYAIRPAPDNEVDFPPYEEFSTFGWPLKIFDQDTPDGYVDATIVRNEDNSINQNKSYFRLHFHLNYLLVAGPSLERNFLYIKDSFNLERFSEYEFFLPPDTNRMRVELEGPLNVDIIPIPQNPPAINTFSISKFIYGYYAHNPDYSRYFNDLIGPIDVSPIYEAEDFFTMQGNQVQWVVYNKPKIYRIGINTILGQMKVVFQGTGDDSSPGTDTRTRLYIIYPVDSDNPNYATRGAFLSGKAIIGANDGRTFTNLIYDNKLSKSSDIRIWKGTVLDNSVPVNVLALRNMINDSDNVNTFIQLGLTHAEYLRVFPNIPENLRYNCYFYLQEVAVTSSDQYNKYRVGVNYDNPDGILLTFINESEPVYVYSIDNKFFTTADYAAGFEYAETFAKTAVEILPYTAANLNNIWDGEYGFDWMRKTTQGFPGTNFRYPPFASIVGTVPTQTDGNNPNGFFVPDTDMYNNLKASEYNAIPLDWRISESDTDIEYFTPWLTILKGQTRTLKLSIKIGDTLPNILRIKFQNTVFQLTSPMAQVAVVPNEPRFRYLIFNKSELAINSVVTTTLTVRYRDEPQTKPDEDKIWIKAIYGDGKEKVAGVLNLFTPTESNSIKERKLDLLFVPVAVNLPLSGPAYKKDNLLSTIPTLENDVVRFFAHANINPEIRWFDGQLPVSGGDLSPLCIVGGNLIGNPASNIGTSDTNQLHIYLRQKLIEYDSSVNIKKNTIILFFINTPGGMLKPDGTFTGLGGYSSGTGTDIIIFRLAAGDRSTVSHEIFHSLGVPHTFDKTDDNSAYVYQGFKTENVMDYVDPTPLATTVPVQDPVLDAGKHSTYHWQWLIARNNIGKK